MVKAKVWSMDGVLAEERVSKYGRGVVEFIGESNEQKRRDVCLVS